ncbi:MAG: MarR family winged helix-turn-helix transcriptional regulator [Gaiellaceae bacterium]
MSSSDDRPQPRNILIQLFILGQLAGQLLGRELAEARIDRNDYAVLTVIGAYGPITPTDLATKLGLPPTTLSTSIRRLGDQVARTPHPTDRRSYLLELTSAGTERARAGQPALGRSLQAIRDQAGERTPELEDALLDVQRILRAALDATAKP